MKKFIFLFVVALFATTAFAQFRILLPKRWMLKTPTGASPTPHPYRWLEDMKDPEVNTWFKAQADLTNATMNTIAGRDELIAEWRKLDKLQPPQIYFPIKEGTTFSTKKECPAKR